MWFMNFGISGAAGCVKDQELWVTEPNLNS
jgi:hypothetical protein